MLYSEGMGENGGNSEMHDLHCHILPELDDGAQSMEETLTMARLAAKCGTKCIVCTPHCRADDPLLAERLNLIEDYTHHANRMLRQESVSLQLLTGMELLCLYPPRRILQEGNFLTLAGTNYLLIEFPFDAQPELIVQSAIAVNQAGLFPVIAHPERYECVQQNPQLIQNWFRRGWVIQVNRGSVAGSFGTAPQLAAKWMLLRGLAHVVASDAHSPYSRTPNLLPGYIWVKNNCSEAFAKLLFHTNPLRILNNYPIAAARR